ncbi:MAG: nuclear transport factor 2 family protein [Longimicrobiales bacterium]
MRNLLVGLLTCVLAGACVSTTPQTRPAGSIPPVTQEAEVLGVIRGLFDGMRQADTVAIRASFHPEARLVTTGEQDGRPTVQIIPIDRFIASIASAQGYLDERTYDPVVHIDGNLAQVWTFYTFDLAGTFSHCGTDAFLLVRTDAGWKIINVADTRYQDPGICADLAPVDVGRN